MSSPVKSGRRKLGRAARHPREFVGDSVETHAPQAGGFGQFCPHLGSPPSNCACAPMKARDSADRFDACLARRSDNEPEERG